MLKFSLTICVLTFSINAQLRALKPHSSLHNKKDSIMRVLFLLVCLLPLLFCQANAAPKSWSESFHSSHESYFEGKLFTGTLEKYLRF